MMFRSDLKKKIARNDIEFVKVCTLRPVFVMTYQIIQSIILQDIDPIQEADSQRGVPSAPCNLSILMAGTHH